MDEEGISLRTTIFERCRDTRQQFVDLLSEIADQRPQKSVLSDSLERFMLWAGNLGAMRQPSSKLSLDRRLLKAPEVHNLICQHVDDIHEAITELSGVLLQDGAPENDGEETLGPDPDDEEPFDAAGMLLEVIAEAISSLFRLGILVRKSSPTDRFKRALQMSDTSFYDTVDIGHVRDKHPKMRDPEKDWLTTRLGRLISQRRVFIKYCRDHKARLEYQEPLGGETSGEQATQTQLQSSKATTFHLDRLPISVLLPTPAGREDIDQLEEEDVDEVVSVMSASTMSNALSVLKLPTLADLSTDGQAFECPICLTLQHFQREKAWKVHAFRDLKAYVCTAGEADWCNEEYFGDRNTWFEHELHYHRAHYICAVCQDQQPVPYSAFARHMADKHPQVSGNDLKAIEEVSRQIPTHFNANDCPFCDDWAEQIRQKADPKGKRPTLLTPIPDSPCTVSTIRFKRHVALHQEQLAIFALPRMVEGEDQADNGETDKSIVSSEPASTHQSQVSRDSPDNLRLEYNEVAEEILNMLEDKDFSEILAPCPQYSSKHSHFLIVMGLRFDAIRREAESLTSKMDSNDQNADMLDSNFVEHLWGFEQERRSEIERLAAEVERLKSSPSLRDETHEMSCTSVAAEVDNMNRMSRAWLYNEDLKRIDFEKTIPEWQVWDEFASTIKLHQTRKKLAAITTQLHTATPDPDAGEAVSLERPAINPLQIPKTQIDLNTPEDPPPTTKERSTARRSPRIAIRSVAIHKTLELDPSSSWQEADAIIRAAHGNAQPQSGGQALIQQGHYTLRLVKPTGSRFTTVDKGNWKDMVQPGSFLRLLPWYGGLRTKKKDRDKRSVAGKAESKEFQLQEEEVGGAPFKEAGDEHEESKGDKSRDRLIVDDRRHRQLETLSDRKTGKSLSSVSPELAPVDFMPREDFIEASLIKRSVESEADVIDVERKRSSAEAEADEPSLGQKKDT